MYNFYNPNDGAVGDVMAWPMDQVMKPDTGSGGQGLSYNYNAGTFTESHRGWPTKTLNLLTNTLPGLYDVYAAMAYGAKSKSTGLGATDNVEGPFTVEGEVNVSNAFSAAPNSSANFNAERADHSGQFLLDNMSRGKYWNVLLKRFGIQPSRDQTPNLGDRPGVIQ